MRPEQISKLLRPSGPRLLCSQNYSANKNIYIKANANQDNIILSNRFVEIRRWRLPLSYREQEKISDEQF